MKVAFPQRHCSIPAKVYDYVTLIASNMRSLCPKLLLTWARLLLKSKVVRSWCWHQGEIDSHQVNIVTGEATVIDKNTVKRGDLRMREPVALYR